MSIRVDWPNASRITWEPARSDKVMSHHGSLSAKLRLGRENRLKRGELKALVATASLSWASTLVQSNWFASSGRRIRLPLFCSGSAAPSTGAVVCRRDAFSHLAEMNSSKWPLCFARFAPANSTPENPQKPLDVLAQQMVACGLRGLAEAKLLSLRSAYPYRELTRKEFDDVLRMLAEGFSTKGAGAEHWFIMMPSTNASAHGAERAWWH